MLYSVTISKSKEKKNYCANNYCLLSFIQQSNKWMQLSWKVSNMRIGVAAGRKVERTKKSPWHS